MNQMIYMFRQFRNWDENDLAKVLAISESDYKNLESGLEKVDEETAMKLSELYLAPPNLFLSNDSPTHFSIFYSHCSFENSNGFVNHLQNQKVMEMEVKDYTIQILLDEVKSLREVNAKLIDELMRK